MSISEVVKIAKRIRRLHATSHRRFCNHVNHAAHPQEKAACITHASGSFPNLVLFFADAAYFAVFTSPRYFSIGSTFGALPSHASYIFARSSVFPRDRTIFRNRSPFARVSPP
jgi:hypothetical protein